MIRALIISSLVCGGLAHADGDGDGARRASAPRIAQGPTPPKPPRAPAPPQGINVRINGKQLDLSGIDGMVRSQLDAARDQIRNNASIPGPLKIKLLARFDKVRTKVLLRLGKIKGKPLSEAGEELGKLGEDLEEALSGLETEVEEATEQIVKDLKITKDKRRDDDDDDIEALPMAPNLDDIDDGDMREALNDLKNMTIQPQQKAKIQQYRAEADQKVHAARGRLEELSRKLENALGNPRTSTADIERFVDDISREEATIRKARIVSWVKARALLDEAQRKRIEAAASKRHDK